ncbi:MAG TPA: hypothetical protein VFW07_10630 [Parafilimonas sp.]|nr:hypothetical protein [Parafilimonas sp.]
MSNLTKLGITKSGTYMWGNSSKGARTAVCQTGTHGGVGGQVAN